MDAPWILTYTGKQFHFTYPLLEEICIEDIAHGLSMICRFAGHTKFHYSVAQHSYYASNMVPSSFALEALLHDASEAYIGDMTRSFKHQTTAGNYYMEIEDTIQKTIMSKFGLSEKMSPEVKKADNLLLYAEKEQIMPPKEWDIKWGDATEAANIIIERWTPEFAKEKFISRFNVLQQSSLPKDPVQCL